MCGHLAARRFERAWVKESLLEVLKCLSFWQTRSGPRPGQIMGMVEETSQNGNVGSSRNTDGGSCGGGIGTASAVMKASHNHEASGVTLCRFSI